MSSEGYVEYIPTVKAGITAAEFAVKEEVLKNVLVIRNCSEFYSESKHTSLYQAGKAVVRLMKKRMH